MGKASGTAYHLPSCKTMNAIEITAPGGPEVLEICRRPIPEPGPGEVLIKVVAAGVNRADLMQRRGLYPPPKGASDIPGLEVAGIVVALGPGVRTPRLGERVCALITGGGYAEYCCADAQLCLPIPGDLSMTEAASLPEACFTVWANLIEIGQLRHGERVLIHGGASGIGSYAIQLAQTLGAEVFATAGSPAKCDLCAQLGAQPINYRDENFTQRILDQSGGYGVDVILDMIGGPYLARHLELLAPGGRLIIIATQGGPKTEINLLPILLKRLTISGSTLRGRPLAAKTRLAEALQARLWPLLVNRQIRPIIDRGLALADAAKAHALMERGEHMGKLILNVTDANALMP
jgi:NADPH2:quinone reductase